ncbi:GntR family transcriptional regulator [Rhodococcus opacus]|uniref:GntR family transcriptional regulator n=1 Tax=Rhodococcus opacus TaxID=37919 RepID=UPI002953FB58|nr:GntR family transcriptional regulator [Rhodococcus opacus]MDV7090346.1 GntR family transcriptional regulator [Rhodococcus opacus]
MTTRRTAQRSASIGGTHQSLRDRAYIELRERIIEGRYPAGFRLVERELSEEFGLSRIPLREALQRLESEGFVTVAPRRGAVVAKFDAEAAEHLFDVRESLEGLAARLAALHATADELDALHAIVARSRAAAETGKTRQVVALNADFHRTIVEASHNPLLQDLMAPLDARLRRLFHLTSTRDDGDTMCGEHEQLYQALRARDADGAEELARRHVVGTRVEALRSLAAETGTT